MKKKSFILVVFLLLGLFFLSACQGEVGEAGLKGPTGDQGEQGEKGETGDKGATGAKGATGDKGADAANVVLDITSDGIVWKNEGDESWQPVISFDDLFAYRHTYTITLDANGGTIEQSEIKNCIYKVDAIIEFSPSYVMEGVDNEWTFMGWKDSKDGTIYEDGGVVNVLRDYTLVAQWSAEIILGGVEEAQGAPRFEYLKEDKETLRDTAELVNEIRLAFLDDYAEAAGLNKLEAIYLKQMSNVSKAVNMVKEITLGETPVAYKFGYYRPSEDKVLYLTGADDGRYLATTADEALAADVYLEAAEGGYKVYIVEGEGESAVKKYLEVYKNGSGKIAARFDASAVAVWAFDASAYTLTQVFESKTYYLGTYVNNSGADFGTASASDITYISGDSASKIGDTQFPAALFTSTTLKDKINDSLACLGGLAITNAFELTDFAEEWAWLFAWVCDHPDTFYGIYISYDEAGVGTIVTDSKLGQKMPRADHRNDRATYMKDLFNGNHADNTSRDSEMKNVNQHYAGNVFVGTLMNFFFADNQTPKSCSDDKTISFQVGGKIYSSESDTEGVDYDPYEGLHDLMKITLEPSITFALGDPAYELIPVKRDGYVFKGWYLNEDGSGDPITSVDAKLNGQIVYAVWEAVAE